MDNGDKLLEKHGVSGGQYSGIQNNNNSVQFTGGKNSSTNYTPYIALALLAVVVVGLLIVLILRKKK